VLHTDVQVKLEGLEEALVAAPAFGRSRLQALVLEVGKYAFPIKLLHTFLERLSGGRRPPTGPLTTAETADAEELRQETLAKDAERIDQEGAGDGRGHEV
jgi:hypothetical protein